MSPGYYATDTRRTGRGPSGFTFLEILIALCVVLIALVPLIRLHVTSMRMIDAGAHRARATLLANDRLAEMMTLEKLDVGKANGRVEDANDGTVYCWTAEVTEAHPSEVETLPLPGLRQVHVEVAWQDGGQAASVALDTYARTPVAQEQATRENENHEKSKQRTTQRSGLGL